MNTSYVLRSKYSFLAVTKRKKVNDLQTFRILDIALPSRVPVEAQLHIFCMIQFSYHTLVRLVYHDGSTSQLTCHPLALPPSMNFSFY